MGSPISQLERPADARAGDVRAGDMLREWRHRRRLSQLDLASQAEVSAKHLSYVETGRSRPSPEMVLHLCEHLEVPLRDRNAILLAAGHAPRYPETPWSDAGSSGVRDLLDVVLSGHRYPVVVIDSRWELVGANPAAEVFTAMARPSRLAPPVNLVELTLHPDGLAPHVGNLTEVATHLLTRVRRSVERRPDLQLAALVDDYAHLVSSDPPAHPGATVPIELVTTDGTLRFSSTLATFGSPWDVTLSELAIEAFYPSDPATRAWFDRWEADGGRPQPG